MTCVICELCARRVPLNLSYIVRMDIFADPSIPPISSEELDDLNLDDEMKRLMEEMKHLSAEDLQDQVHRRFEYRLCRPCQLQFLSNPLGKPRQKADRMN